jgi:hypothetical protein
LDWFCLADCGGSGWHHPCQTGDGFDLSWNVIGGGGSQGMAGSGFLLDSTAGQSAVGNLQGGSYQMCIGFGAG